MCNTGLQVNLFVGDYLKGDASTQDACKEAVQIMRWFQNHTVPASLLAKAIKEDLGRACKLVFPCATRWSSIVLAISRFLEVCCGQCRVVPIYMCQGQGCVFYTAWHRFIFDIKSGSPPVCVSVLSVTVQAPV